MNVNRHIRLYKRAISLVSHKTEIIFLISCLCTSFLITYCIYCVRQQPVQYANYITFDIVSKRRMQHVQDERPSASGGGRGMHPRSRTHSGGRLYVNEIEARVIVF